MSRSKRKTPIFGRVICASEREDKTLWHRKFRSRERVALKSANSEQLIDYLPISEKQVSNPWAMGKDGHWYFPISEHKAHAEYCSTRQGQTLAEKIALKKRFFRKLMAK